MSDLQKCVKYLIKILKNIQFLEYIVKMVSLQRKYAGPKKGSLRGVEEASASDGCVAQVAISRDYDMDIINVPGQTRQAKYVVSSGRYYYAIWCLEDEIAKILYAEAL